MSEIVAVREEEDAQYVLFGSKSGAFIVRKSDRKVLALPWTPETNSLHVKIRSAKNSFIADALADFATDAKWRSPRSLGVKPTHGEDLYAA